MMMPQHPTEMSLRKAPGIGDASRNPAALTRREFNRAVKSRAASRSTISKAEFEAHKKRAAEPTKTAPVRGE